MRKATFTSHRFQIEFGITEENEDEVKAAQNDVLNAPEASKQESTCLTIEDIPSTPLLSITEDLTTSIESPIEGKWHETTVPSTPPILPILKPSIIESVSPANGNIAPIRRQTMPELSSDQLSRLSRKPIHSSRRPSITNVAICSSIGPSLAGIFPGAPSNLFLGTADEVGANTQLLVSSLRRSSTFSALNEPLSLEEAARDARGRRWSSRLPFLRTLQHQDSRESSTTDNSEVQLIDQQQRSKHHHHYHHHHHHHHHLPHLHVPTFSITGPSSEGSGGSGTGRKFSFGIRRHSHTVGPAFNPPFAGRGSKDTK